MPPGTESIWPVPFTATLSVKTSVNVAVTFLIAVMLATHVLPAPGVQSPVQTTVSLPVGVAVSVTDAPLLNVLLHVPVLGGSQLIVPGLDVTVPSPLPAAVTFSANVGTNVAVTFRAWSIVNTHDVPVVQVPGTSPDQPLK